MKSILCDDHEINKAENLIEPVFFISSRIASLQNISEQLSKVDLDKPRAVHFETILNPSAALQKRYKSILEEPAIGENTERATQTSKSLKNSHTVSKDSSKGLKTGKNPVKGKNFIKSNKQDLKSSSAPVTGKPSSLKTTPRGIQKPSKHVTITEPGSEINSSFKNNPNTQLLPLFFKQFSEVVLDQWEEATDLLIDELLYEEISHLNQLESSPDPVPENIDEIYLELQRIESFKSQMKAKYLNT